MTTNTQNSTTARQLKMTGSHTAHAQTDFGSKNNYSPHEQNYSSIYIQL